MILNPRDRFLSLLSLLWEQLWPPLACMLAVLALFTALAWLGVWETLPPPLPLLALAAGVALTLWSVTRLPLHWPTPRQRLSRIEQHNHWPHQPLQGLADTPISSQDPVTQALWEAHRETLTQQTRRPSPVLPRSPMIRYDGRALRTIPLLLLVPAWFIAGDQRQERLSASLAWPAWTHTIPPRLDLWITPPAYTRKPPLMLGQMPKQTHAIPQDSILTLHGEGMDRFRPLLAPDLTPATVSALEQTYTLTTDTTLSLKDQTIELHVIPDQPPTVIWNGPPEIINQRLLRLSYRPDDDYAVAAATAHLSRSPPLPSTARPLYEPESLALGPVTAGTPATSQLDLIAHPWAGSQVEVKLRVTDDRGQQGETPPLILPLPHRAFSKPLAVALIEQRHRLADDAMQRLKVLAALEGITETTDLTEVTLADYIGLRLAVTALRQGRSQQELRQVVEMLWDVAIRHEDGRLADQQQAVDAAQDALRQALERQATEEELGNLTQRLREAVAQYLSTLFETPKTQPHDSADLGQIPDDVSARLDEIETLARSGAHEQARQRLEALMQMLAAAQGQQQLERQNQAARQMLDELADLARQQQALQDQTFRHAQTAPAGRPPPARGAEMKTLADRQQALAEGLEKLREQMHQSGSGAENLTQAAQAMRQAAQTLEGGQAAQAQTAQGEALRALREEAGKLARQMQQGGMETMYDPAGRPVRRNGSADDGSVKIPAQADQTRVREILQELRKRLEERDRPAREREYIERLLQPSHPTR